jgi:hypothetical protein
MFDNSRQIYARPAYAITHAFRSPSHALNIPAAMPVAGGVACMIHVIAIHDGKSRSQPLQRGRYA